MTVSSEVSSETYTGNGVTTVFPFRFKILSASDLVVLYRNKNDVQQSLTLNTDYTVSGVGSKNGGSITLFAPAPDEWTLYMERKVPIVQETDIRNQGNFYPEIHEDAFDYLTMIDQQQQLEIDRSIKVPPGSETNPDDLIEEIKRDAERAENAANKAEAIAETIGDIDSALEQAEEYAGQASQSAISANADRLGAEAARDQAEQYATEASIDFATFNSIAEGIAGTSDGDYFRVPQVIGDIRSFIFYQHVGSDAVEKTDYPSASAVRKALHAPNLIENSIGDDSAPLPTLFGSVSWNASPGGEFSAYGVKRSVLAPPAPSGTVNYLFTHDLSFVKPGSYVAVSFIYTGLSAMGFANFVLQSGAIQGGVTTEDLGNGVFRGFASVRIGETDRGIRVSFGYQQRSSVTAGEVALPMLAVSERQIGGIGGDMSLADYRNAVGVTAANILFNGFADPKWQLPETQPGGAVWTPTSEISSQSIRTLVEKYGAIQYLPALKRSPPSNFDALIRVPLDYSVRRGQHVCAQFYVYVDTVNDERTELSRAAVFFIDGNNTSIEVRAEVIARLEGSLYRVRAQFEYSDSFPRRVSMGVRQTTNTSDYYVFGGTMAISEQPIREIVLSPARDPMFEGRVNGNAPNAIYNYVANPALTQPNLFPGEWTALADLPEPAKVVGESNALAAVQNLRVTSGQRDTFFRIPLTDLAYRGNWVKVRYGVLIVTDGDPESMINNAKVFFWTSSLVAQKVPTVVERRGTNVFIVESEYHYTQQSAPGRVSFGVRNVRTDADFYTFNPMLAVSESQIINITDHATVPAGFDQMVKDISGDTSNLPIYPARLAVNSPIGGAEDLILLPPALYLPPNKPLLLQCPQLLMNWTDDMAQFLDWTLRGIDNDGWPYSYENNRTFELSASKLGSSVSVGMHNRQKPNYWFRRDISLVTAPASAAGTKRICLLGSSVTNRGISHRVSAMLQSRGLTIQQVGTMNQQENGTGEGRESWAAANFVGFRNVINGQPVVVSADNPSNAYKNPFLFVATQDQLSANPAMCFLNTGATRELSYADTQSGTFYTFDYRRYLDQQGFADPDVITIDLTGNDRTYQMTPAEHIAQLTYMVNQIRTACPNCRIGIAGYPRSYMNRSHMNDTISQYIRNIIGTFKGREAENIYVIATWATMPADTEWSSEGSAEVKDSMTGSYRDTRGDGIHWDTHGRQYYSAQCMFPFYMWACSQ